MPAKSPKLRKPKRPSRPKVGRVRAHDTVSAWKVSWTDRDGKTHRTYPKTLEGAVAFASSKSGYISRC